MKKVTKRKGSHEKIGPPNKEIIRRKKLMCFFSINFLIDYPKGGGEVQPQLKS